MLFCSHRSQLLVDRSVQNSSNSDFVFGENMVERVLVRFVNAGRRFTKVNVLMNIIVFRDWFFLAPPILLKMWVNMIPRTVDKKITKYLL